jgi:hypothetical protein
MSNKRMRRYAALLASALVALALLVSAPFTPRHDVALLDSQKIIHPR